MKKDKIDKYENLTEGQLKTKKKIIEMQVVILAICVICMSIFDIIFWIYMINEGACDESIVSNKQVKPIIYIYPEYEQEVEIKLSNPEKLTVTYPKYKKGWRVLAKTTGELIDIETGRSLYSLYWEGKNASISNMKEGFVIEGKDTINFLEEKLEILGLNAREAEEFIIYWLPKMEANKYNYIYFQTMDEIDKNMKLEITPQPETLIRVMMEFKPLEKRLM